MTIEISPGGVGFVRTTAQKSVGSDAAVGRLHRPQWVGTSTANTGSQQQIGAVRTPKQR